MIKHRSPEEKKQWQRNNAIKLFVVWASAIALLFLYDEFFAPPKKEAVIDSPCAIMGDEIVTMSECYDILMNGL